MSSQVPIKTGKKLFDVVEILLELDGATLQEVTDRLAVPKSTIHDYLRTLEMTGYLNKSGNTYYISSEFLRIGGKRRKQRDIYRFGRKEVQQLAIETGEHASLMTEENGMGVILHIAKGEASIEAGAYEGRHIELSVTSPGKAILANMPEDRVEKVLDRHGMPSYTENTFTDRAALLEELETIREEGYATDREEFIDGVWSLSAPIICQGEVFGAVTVGVAAQKGSSEWFNEELPNLVLARANTISLNLIHS